MRVAQSLQLIKQPPNPKKVAKYLGGFFLMSTILLSVTPWQQTAPGTGRVIAYSPTERQQNISATVEGRLGKWYVQEGTFVKKGAPIVDIEDNDPGILENLRAERSAVLNRYKLAQQATQLAKINVERQLNLFNQGISAKRTYELAKLDYARHASEEENSRVALAGIDIRLARQHRQHIVAPIDGTILRRFSGEQSVLVRAGDVIAELVPETNSRAIELWVDSNDLPLIQRGDIARLQFEGWPAIQFSGWPSVAVGTFGGVVAVVDAAANQQGKFRLLIVPGKNDHWPNPKYLRQGVRAHGWVLLSQVKLGYELWRRFNGFPPSQSTPNE